MRIPSRAFVAIAAFLLATPMFRPVHAGETWRIASVRPPDPESPRAVARTSELIVQFRSDADARDVARVTRQAGAARVRRSAFGNRYLMSLDAGFTAAEAIRRLSDQPEVEYAEPNGAVHAFFHPNDRGFSVQWNFQMLQAERTWDIQKGDPSVVVA